MNAQQSFHYDVKFYGNEKQPVVVLDNAILNPEVFVEEAASKDFKPIAPFYPGIRAQAPPAYLQAIVPRVTQILNEVFDYTQGAKLQECFYSLTTTPPNKLTPMQRLPHFDGTEEDKIAILHYLSGEGCGGTSFYRHASTQWETVSKSRFAEYKSTIEAEVDEVGLPEPAMYTDDNNSMFERIGYCQAVFNRLVIYRGINLHGVSVPSGFSFSEDPHKGRLTVNTFITAA